MLAASGLAAVSLAAEALAAIWVELCLLAVASFVYVLFAGARAPRLQAGQVKHVRCARAPHPAPTCAFKTSSERDRPWGRARNVQRPADSTPWSTELQQKAALIRSYARQGDLKTACRVFDNLRASGKELSPLIYNCHLDALVQCGDHEGSVQHFKEMKRLSFADVVGYNTMLKSHLSRENTTEARALVSEMASRGFHANVVTYNELLHAKLVAKDINALWSIVGEMRAAGVKLNAVTCAILLKSLTTASCSDNLRRVIALIGEIEEPIDEVLLSSLIETCIWLRELKLLSNLFRSHARKLGSVRLGAPTYGSMIKAYGQAGDLSRVQELWSEMEERGVQPTPVTFGCMIEALVQNGQAEGAWQLLHKLESDDRKGCINTVIYTTLLKGFAFSKRLEMVFAVYEEMKTNNVACNTITFNTMLDACAKCSGMSRVPSILEDMKLTGTAPDLITYSSIVKGYCLDGNVDRAFRLLEEMRKDYKLAPDEIMYNSILDGCAKQHRVETAMSLLNEMKAAGVWPSNYTLSILVKLLGHARRLPEAFRLVDDLSKQNGFRPNVQVYTCLAQACVINRRLDWALGLHATMVADRDCRVDEKFYAVLARGCLHLHQPLKAADVVRAAHRLPGHDLGEFTGRGRPVGIEAAALAEVAARLQSGSSEEREAFATLRSELREVGVEIDDGQLRCAPRRRGGGRGGRANGQ